jgi:hypothetical protein
MKDCRKRKNVAAARVPSLVSVVGDALVVPGKIGEQPVKAMLCDSGATICVVAEELLPDGTEKLERVWIGTVGMDPKPYPTVAVPAEVDGKKLELYAAVMPEQLLPYPVILGRYIPGKKVAWSMTVSDERGTVSPAHSRNQSWDNHNRQQVERRDTHQQGRSRTILWARASTCNREKGCHRV